MRAARCRRSCSTAKRASSCTTRPAWRPRSRNATGSIRRTAGRWRANASPRRAWPGTTSMPTGNSLEPELELVETTEGLEALRPEWEALWRADPQATPFHAPQWLLPWWRHIGRGRLCTVAMRDDEGSLCGLAPLYVHTERDGRRHLFPVGIGTTDYLGPLSLPGRGEEGARAVFACIAERRERWDVFHCPQLRGDSPLLAAAPREARVCAGEPNPVLALGRDACAIPKSTRANLRTCRNRAARVGALTFHCAGATEIPQILETLARLHASRWSKRGLPGVLADDAVQAAHAEAAPLLHAAGLLRLWGLRLDGEWIAVLYALMHARRCYYYIAGFAPEHAFFSPGSLLLAHAIGQAQAEGATAFDFLRGAEPYKYRWGAIDQPMFALRMEAGVR